METQPTLVEDPNASVLPMVTGKVQYDNVSFAYEADKPVLQNPRPAGASGGSGRPGRGFWGW